MNNLKTFSQLNEAKDPDVLLRELVAELKTRGITPKEVGEWEQDMDAGVTIDNSYSVQISEYMESAPFLLNVWVDKGGKVSDGYVDGGASKQLTSKKTAKEIVDEYIKATGKKESLDEELLSTHKVTWNDAVDACINEIKKHEDKVARQR